ncbi:G-protein alpha subunit [Mycena albidolilacea]|uniref:G-protein alpha subunit n=1 Tax=Mycena albidolilacea TaxID=1033008 RepID=A0AAD7EKY0_9AGAR|nr:G-protein alpha subunit [Mycena albidolilacea]
MGASSSRASSNEQIEQKKKKECRLLMLGSGDSGKSTIRKQLIEDSFNIKDFLAFRPTIHKAVLDFVQAVVLALRAPGLEQLLAERHQHLPEMILAAKSEEPLSSEMANAIETIWRDPVVVRVLDEHQNGFYLMDSALYFVREVQRLAQTGYVPTEEDVLRTVAQMQSTGRTEIRVDMSGITLRIVDLGDQQSDWEKWIHSVESVTSVIFCVPLSDYDEFEENGQNRMRRSLALFERIINDPYFIRSSIILFLTKLDIFRDKVTTGKAPLERHFPDYIGGPDVNNAARYVLWRFMQQNRARLSVYPHLTQATENSCARLVLAAVKETILQNVMKDSEVNGPLSV